VKHSKFILVAMLWGLLVLPSAVSAQVFNSGPDVSTLFDTVFNVPPSNGPLPSFAGAVGQAVQVNVADGGETNVLFDPVLDSQGNLIGGAPAPLFEFFGSDNSVSNSIEVNVSGGTVGGIFASFDSEVNVSGGTVNFLNASGVSQANIGGGTVNVLSAFSDSEVIISGGSLDVLLASSGSEVNISGGSVNDRFEAFSGSEVNLIGTEFFLDGKSLLGSLAVGESFLLVDRGVGLTLSGTLADGSAFDFELNPTEDTTASPDLDFFAPDATLTLTLSAVPEPSSGLLMLGLCVLTGLRRNVRRT